MATYLVWTPFLAGEGWTLPGWVEVVEYGLVAAAGIWAFRQGRLKPAPLGG